MRGAVKSRRQPFKPKRNTLFGIDQRIGSYVRKQSAKEIEYDSPTPVGYLSSEISNFPSSRSHSPNHRLHHGNGTPSKVSPSSSLSPPVSRPLSRSITPPPSTPQMNTSSYSTSPLDPPPKIRSKSLTHHPPFKNNSTTNTPSISRVRSYDQHHDFFKNSSTSSPSKVNNVDIDQEGNFNTGILLSPLTTELLLKRSNKKSFIRSRTKPKKSNAYTHLYATLDSAMNSSNSSSKRLAISPVKFESLKRVSLGINKNKEGILKKLFETRVGIAQESLGIGSTTLIDYAFLVGPNIHSLETAFSAESKSRAFTFHQLNCMSVKVDAELLYLDSKVDDDIEIDALPSFCFPSGIEITGQYGTVQSAGPVIPPSGGGGLLSRGVSRKKDLLSSASTTSRLKLSKYPSNNNIKDDFESRTQSFVFMLQNHTSNHYGVCVVLPRRFIDIEKDLTITTNYCICLITEYPYFSFLIDAIQRLNNLGGLHFDTPIEMLSGSLILHNQLHHFTNFITKLRKLMVPGIGRQIEILYTINQHILLLSLLRLHGPQKGINIITEKENEISYHTMLWGLPTLLSSMPLDQVILALGCMLTEMKIIVVSPRIKEISACILVLLNLVHPLKWSCPAIISCPDSMLGYIEAPCPIILGMQKLPDNFVPTRGIAVIDMTNENTCKNCVGLHFDDIVTSHTLNMPQSNALIKRIKHDVAAVLTILKKTCETCIFISDSNQVWDEYTSPPELDLESEDGKNLRSAVVSISTKITTHITTLINTSVVQDKDAKANAARRRQLNRAILSARLTSGPSTVSSFGSNFSLDFSPMNNAGTFTNSEVGEKGRIFIKRFLDTQMYADYCHRMSALNQQSIDEDTTSILSATQSHDSFSLNGSDTPTLVLSHNPQINKNKSNRQSGRYFNPVAIDGRHSNGGFVSEKSESSILSSTTDACDPNWQNVFSIMTSGTCPLPDNRLQTSKDFLKAGVFPPNFSMDSVNITTSSPQRLELDSHTQLLCNGLCGGFADTPYCKPICSELWQRVPVANRRSVDGIASSNLHRTMDFSGLRNLRTSPPRDFAFLFLNQTSQEKYRNIVQSLQHKRYLATLRHRRYISTVDAACVIQRYFRGYLCRSENLHNASVLKSLRRKRIAIKFRRILNATSLNHVYRTKALFDIEISHKSQVSFIDRVKSKSHSLTSPPPNSSSIAFLHEQHPLETSSIHSSGSVRERSVDGAESPKFTNTRSSVHLEAMLQSHLQQSFQFASVPIPLQGFSRTVFTDLTSQQKSIIEDLYEMLRDGIAILKHNPHSRPKYRLLYCDEYMKKLYWRRLKEVKETSNPELAFRRSSFAAIQEAAKKDTRSCFSAMRGRCPAPRLDWDREVFLDEILEIHNSVYTPIMTRSKECGYLNDGGDVISVMTTYRTLDFEIDHTNHERLFKGLIILSETKRLSRDRRASSSYDGFHTI